MCAGDTVRSHGSRVIRSIAITRVFTQQQWLMFFQSKISRVPRKALIGSREGGRWSEKNFGVSACGLLGFPLLKFFMHSSPSSSSSSLHIFRETIFGGCRFDGRTDGQTYSRASSVRLNVLDRLINFASKRFASFSSLNWIVSEIDDAEVDLYSVYVVKCRVSHPLHSSSFLATMRPLRCAASIWPSSILNSVNASSTSCCVNLSPQVISECLNLKVKWRDYITVTFWPSAKPWGQQEATEGVEDH